MNAPQLRQPEFQRADSGAGEVDLRYLIAGLAAAALFLYLIKPILLPFAVSGIVAYVCAPLLDWLARKTRLPRWLFAVAAFLILIGIATALVTVIGERLLADTGGAFGDLQGSIENLLRGATGGQPIHLFGQSMDAGEVVRGAFGRLNDWLNQSDRVAQLTGYGLLTFIDVILSIVLLIWLLITGPSVARGLFWLVPPNRRELAGQIWTRLDPLLKRYFIGIFATVVYATAAAYVGLAFVLGLDHALLLSLMTGIAETLPFIGSTAVAVIAGLVALHMATGFMSIVAFALYATLLRLSIDELVAPLVLGRAANLHPVVIIFSLLAGAVTFGVTGIILSVPVALAIKSTLAILYGEDDGPQAAGS